MARPVLDIPLPLRDSVEQTELTLPDEARLFFRKIGRCPKCTLAGVYIQRWNAGVYQCLCTSSSLGHDCFRGPMFKTVFEAVNHWKVLNALSK